MSDNKKYYYIKLKDNYFDQDNIKILESLPNGHVYSLIVVKLYLKATKYGGQLKMTDSIPYSPETINTLASVIGHDIAHVKEAVKFAVEFDLITILDSGDIWMTEIQNLIGQSSTEADRIREYRKKIKCTNVQQLNDKSTPEIDKDLESEVEPEPEPEIKKEKITVPVGLSLVLETKLKDFIKYRKVIKKPLKTNRSIESMVKKIGVDFVNEDHLIKCIDYVMDNEYQGVKSEYVKYDKPVFKKSVVSKLSKHIVTLEEAKSNPEFNKMDGVDFMDIVNKKRVNNGK